MTSTTGLITTTQPPVTNLIKCYELLSDRRFGFFVVEGFFGGMVGLTSASARLRRDKWCFVTE
jgi:hypothetical protein